MFRHMIFNYPPTYFYGLKLRVVLRSTQNRMPGGHGYFIDSILGFRLICLAQGKRIQLSINLAPMEFLYHRAIFANLL